MVCRMPANLFIGIGKYTTCNGFFIKNVLKWTKVIKDKINGIFLK